MTAAIVGDQRQALETALRRQKLAPTVRFTYTRLGPDHALQFQATVHLEGGVAFTAASWSSTKKAAEKSACRVALEALLQRAPDGADWKVQLQKARAKLCPGQQITYGVTKRGPDDRPTFYGQVAIGTRIFRDAVGCPRKTDAEAEAARLALRSLLNENAGSMSGSHSVAPTATKPRAVAVIRTEPGDAAPPRMLLSEPRLYQVEMYRAAMRANVLCCLPTGTGKTLIACLVIKRMHELNPLKQVVFLTDRIPLVEQQAHVIARETGLCAIAFRGGRPASASDLARAQVLVVIAAFYENLLASGAVWVEDVALVVVDEAHHIIGQHPFARLLQDRFWAQPRPDHRPKLLALTASPAASSDLFETVVGLVELRDRIRGVIVRPRGPAFDAMRAHTSPADPEIISVRARDAKAQFRTSVTALFGFEWRRDGAHACLHYDRDLDRARYGADAPGVHAIVVDDGNGRRRVLSRDYVLTAICKLVFKDCVDFGPDVAFTHLVELNARYDDALLATDQLDRARRLLDQVQPIARTKCTRLVRFLSENPDSDADARTIVFVSTRRSAQILSALLVEHGFRAGVVTGHGTGGDGGMNHAAQTAALNDFRTCRTRILVATSVLEEGFDVPGCHVVIRMDLPSTVTALVQSRGRARRLQSRFVVIATERERAKFAELLAREALIEAAVDVLELSDERDVSAVLQRMTPPALLDESPVYKLNLQLAKAFASHPNLKNLVRFKTVADELTRRFRTVVSVDRRIGSVPGAGSKSSPGGDRMVEVATGVGLSKKAAEACAARHLIETHFVLTLCVRLSNDRLRQWL